MDTSPGSEVTATKWRYCRCRHRCFSTVLFLEQLKHANIKQCFLLIGNSRDLKSLDSEAETSLYMKCSVKRGIFKSPRFCCFLQLFTAFFLRLLNLFPLHPSLRCSMCDLFFWSGNVVAAFVLSMKLSAGRNLGSFCT